MEKYVINGGKPLQGEVDISGAKNAAVAIIPAALMVDGICRIENMPQISDTDMLLTILTQLGAEVRMICPGTIEIDSRNVRFCDAPFELMRKIRASYYLIGAMLGRFGSAKTTMPGGCNFGGRPGLNPAKQEIAETTNRACEKGTLADVIKDADVFIGVSAPGVLTSDMVRTMARDAIVFACANPTPEIFPDEAKRAGAAIVSTGRSDYPNQINNVLAFPGIFRGALDARASDINDEMKIAAAHALAGMVSEDKLSCDNILPQAFDEGVGETVAAAVKAAAIKSGVARI